MVKPRRGEKRCGREMPVWMGDDFKTPGFMKPISREIFSICTPRICNEFNNPIYNIGSSTMQKWIKIEDGEIRRTNNPQEFIPASHSKEEQIVTKENDIFSQKQKAEFKIFNLVQNTRQLLKEEIIHRMYPAEVLSRINEDTRLDETSTNDFISYNLQEAFLPWPLNYLHLIPDWLILTVLSILGLFLVKIFFDPAVACCTLIRDSSLSLTQKISSAILPATSITWMNKKKNQEIENGSLEDFEMRVSDLEDQMTVFKTVFIRDTEKNIQPIRRIEVIE